MWESKGSEGEALWDTNEAIHGRAPLQMVQLLEKGEQNPSQISRDHHVTRSLLYVWWQLYRERGEAALVPRQAFHSPPEVDRPQNAQEQIAHLERLCGQQGLELDLLRSEVDVLKKRSCRFATPMMMKIGDTSGQREALRSRPRQWSTKPDKKARRGTPRTNDCRHLARGEHAEES